MAKRKTHILEQKHESMLTCGQRAIDLINLVRSLQSVEEKGSPPMDSVGLREALMESIEMLENRFSQKGVRAVIDIDPDINVIAEKTSLINSIFNNVFTNAIKFSYPDSEIVIKASREGENISTIIQDFGIGIPHDIMEKLFKIDKKVTRHGTQGEKGTGFGMSIIRKFVKINGGQIEVFSKEESEYPEEHGTVVKIVLKSV